MELIENAGRAWRMFSVQALAIIAVLNSLEAAWPQLAPFTSPSVQAGVTVAFAVAGIVGRVIKQTSVEPSTKEEVQ